MIIDVYQTLKKDKITHKEDGVKIFNAFKGVLNKNPDIKQMELDFKDMKMCNEVVFDSLIKEMKKRLEGYYAIVVHNANVFIKLSFNNSTKKSI